MGDINKQDILNLKIKSLDNIEVVSQIYDEEKDEFIIKLADGTERRSSYGEMQSFAGIVNHAIHPS